MFGWMRGAALATVVALLAGCSSASAPATAQLHVVAALYPYQFVAQRIVGELGQVDSLTQPGAEPHDLELTPAQIASLGSADLVIYQQGFQAAVDDAILQAQSRRVIDALSLITPLPGDPHLWLDPTDLATVAAAVTEQLSGAHPQQADALRANGARLAAELDELDRSFSTGLAGCKRTTFVTSHTAFGYLAARYHLTQVGIAGLDPTVEPTPAQVARVGAVAQQAGVTTIFTEPLTSDALARSLASDLGLTTAVLDPVEGITAASKGSDYLQVMAANREALRTANGCQ